MPKTLGVAGYAGVQGRTWHSLPTLPERLGDVKAAIERLPALIGAEAYRSVYGAFLYENSGPGPTVLVPNGPWTAADAESLRADIASRPPRYTARVIHYNDVDPSFSRAFDPNIEGFAGLFFKTGGRVCGNPNIGELTFEPVDGVASVQHAILQFSPPTMLNPTGVLFHYRHVVPLTVPGANERPEPFTP